MNLRIDRKRFCLPRGIPVAGDASNSMITDGRALRQETIPRPNGSVNICARRSNGIPRRCDCGRPQCHRICTLMTFDRAKLVPALTRSRQVFLSYFVNIIRRSARRAPRRGTFGSLCGRARGLVGRRS